MRGWKVTGFIATILIALSIPVYLMKTALFSSAPDDHQTNATFVGSAKCQDCHKNEYNKWLDSHHDHAMDIANEQNVLGDFDDRTFDDGTIKARFHKKDDRFYVNATGGDGLAQDFEITHTFGWYPLQQYLVPFDGGRLQCFPVAWDARDNRWYDLNAGKTIDPSDWLHWTNAGQNWNGMCAECHSTNLKKNYDAKTDTYQTTWSDIDVGCEACHGPGSDHVTWAETPEMGRPDTVNFSLVIDTTRLNAREAVELCAPCHSRRAMLGDYTHAEKDLLDSMLPSLLTPELYFADGQILEEVYVYGSFTQSKMYHRDVKCADCHDVHSVKLAKEGNALCLQCHRSDEYDTAAHHFHKKPGEAGEPIKSVEGTIMFDVGSGADCAGCHMPGQVYMGIDYRPDHSFRIPRPDLTDAIAPPNACNRCHVDETARWADEWIAKWYGPARKRHYGEVIEAGRRGAPEAGNKLVMLSMDPLYPVIVRATALSLMKNYSPAMTHIAYETALMDDEALIRQTAVENMNIANALKTAELLGPLLYDPVKAVRVQAAARLAGEASKQLRENEKVAFDGALDEYIEAMEYSADFSFGCFNLATLYQRMDKPELAAERYQAAINIDPLFYPAKVNLAMLYNERGDKEKAEKLLREVVSEHPQRFEFSYSLALLLAERNKIEEAAEYMGQVAAHSPNNARIHYNYGLLSQLLNRTELAEKELKMALDLEPENLDYMYALFEHYFKNSDLTKAKSIAEKLLSSRPESAEVQRLLEAVERRQK